MAWGDDDPIVGQGTSAGWGNDDPVVFELNPKKKAAPAAPLSTPQGDDVPSLLGVGWENLKGDIRTGASRLASGVGLPETAASIEAQAKANYERAGRRPIADLDEDLVGGLYEGAVSSLPAMGPTVGGALTGAKLGATLGPWGAGIGAVAGGAAAALPQFLGSNLKRQQVERNIPLSETSVAVAAPTAVVQALADSLIGRVVPGIGKAAAGNILARAAKKGLEGGAIEGSTETLQQWLEVLQANPEKAWDMPPEVQRELRHAAILGSVVGGGVGAVGGAASGRRDVAEPATLPVSPEAALPPPTQYVPMGTGLARPADEPLEAPGLDSGTGLPEFTKIDHPLTWSPRGTGLAVPNQPLGIDSGTGLPDVTTQPDAEFEAVGTGLPIPRRPRPLEAPGLPSGTGLADPGRLPIQDTGQRVYKAVQQELLAQGVPPMQANANASLWRARYTTLGKQLGTDAYSAFKASGVEIKGTGGPTITGTTLNQDPLTTLDPRHFSALQSALTRAPMKSGTGQQWLNYFTKQGVKKDEMEWSTVAEGLEKYKNEKLTPDVIQHWFKSFEPAIYVAKPHDQNKPNHYGGWTLGEYGKNPESGYREVVLGMDQMPRDTYKSPHFGMVPNAIAHYRTTDRVSPDGKKVLLAEEFQSDWHQAARKKGYRSDDQALIDAMDRFSRAKAAVVAAHGTGRLAAAMKALNEAGLALHLQQQGLPNAPFKDTWPNLVFRYALMDAIRDGRDYIAWPTGDQIAESNFARENPSFPEKLRAFEAFYDKRIVDYANKLGKAYGAKVETIAVANDAHRDPIAEAADAAVGITPRTGLTVSDMWRVHALPITSQMRELIGAGGLPLFQRGKSPQGNITIAPDRAIIRLFKTANASTFPHESAHLWLDEMIRYAPENKQIAQDLQAVLNWFGVPSTKDIKREHHEMFARGFEQYLRTGKAPSSVLRDIFKQFSEWLKAIYRRAADLKVDISPEMSKVYDRLLQSDKSLKEVDERSEVLPPRGTNQTFVQKADRRSQLMRKSADELATMAFKMGLPERQYAKESGGRLSKMELVDNILRAEEGQTFEQTPADEPGSTYNLFQRAAKATKAFFDPFSEIPEESAYRDIRNLMTGGVYTAEKSAEKAKKLFNKLSLVEKEAVNTFFETRAANPTMVPANVRQETVALKQYINGPLKKALIDNNLLPDTAITTNDDSYLPRLYLKHILDNPKISGGARLNKSFSKKRKDQTPEALIAMGEIKDPGVRAYYALFRTQRDLAVMEFLDKVAANGDWAIKESLVPWNGKKVTPYWLKQEADAIREVRIPAEPNPDRKAQMKIMAEQMDEAATAGIQALNQIDYDPKDYSKLPDTSDYGPLRGMIVRKQIAMDIQGTNNFVDPNNPIDRWFGDRNSVLTRATSIWKVLKVPMNPPSQMRNIMSNMILLNLSGVPIHRVGVRMYQAAQDMLNNGPYYQIAKKYGVGKGTFSEQELYAINDELKRLDTKDLAGFAGWRAVYRAMAKVGKAATDWHGKMEEWGKVAKIMDAMKRGMPENDAVREANKWLFDYSEAVPAVKRLRQMPLGMPFITFQYKMIPLMTEIIKNHPTRLLPYIALAYTVPAIVAASNDIGEDDAEKLRKSLSTNLRRKPSMYLLPWKDDAGRWQFIDIGYFMPWQMPFDVARHTGKAAYEAVAGSGREATKEASEAFRATSLLSNPVLSVAAALTTGVDPFTDRPIADKRDPAQKQVADVVAYAWSLAMPSLLASYGAAGQLVGRETGAGVNRYGEPPATTGQIAARAVGVNTYAVVPEAQRARNIQYMMREIQDVKGRMTSSLKDQSLTAEQRRRVAENYRGEIMERTKELQRYVQESAPSARLRAATGPA